MEKLEILELLEKTMSLDIVALKLRVCDAGTVAVEELIKVAEKPLLDGMNITSTGINPEEDEITSDKLTRAAQAKKIAIFDSFEILAKVETERNYLMSLVDTDNTPPSNFIETRAKDPKK